jgi:hypothetical protein
MSLQHMSIALAEPAGPDSAGIAISFCDFIEKHI